MRRCYPEITDPVHPRRPVDPRRFVLLDRDGTIIVEKHHLSDPRDVELLTGAAAGLRALAELGLGLVVVTNQSVIGRGILSIGGLGAVHDRMIAQLGAHGVRLDGIYFCPHRPDDGCPCRKPGTAMVKQAAEDLGFEAAESFVIGDADSDVGLGHALGATTVLVRTGHGAEALARGCRADHVVADLDEAASLIADLVRKQP